MEQEQKSGDFATIQSPGTSPKIHSIFDFSSEALGQLKLWLEQAGLVLPVSNLVGYRTLTSFSPTWQGSVANPSIGNGSLSGKYLKLGQVIFGFMTLTIGSTTTLGTGYWKFGYPVTSANSALVGGSAQMSVAASLYTSVPVRGDTSYFVWQEPVNGLVGAASPAAWAAGNEINGMFIYTVA